MHLGELSSWPVIGSLALVTVLAVVSKLIGGGLGALTLGKRSALIVGVGMIPRGEVGIIVASIGASAGVFSPQLFAIIVAMSLLTSVIAPPVLKALMTPNGEVDPAQKGEESSPLTRVDESGFG